jgi:hypothetical protein
LSSVLLFDEKIGFSIKGILEYYQGNEEKFIAAKSASGILKIILPHIFAFGLFIMVILHFGVFTKSRNSKLFHFIIYSAFVLGLLELFTPLLIVNGFVFFAYVKLAVFFLFEFLMLYIFWILFKSIAYE